MVGDLPRRAARLIISRRLVALSAVVSALVLAPELWSRWLRARGESGARSAGWVAAAGVPLEPPQLVFVEPGTRFKAGSAPPGWSHLILETVPRLATGDLDTVSEQAHEVARKIRPVILADVKPSPNTRGPRFHLARVGVGLCATGQDADSRVIVSPTSIGGAAGPWTTKQRLILTAMSLESSRSRLPVSTPTFAALRTPVTFRVSGNHRKIDLCYAFLVDPSSGTLDTIIWTEDGSEADPQVARRPSGNVFDSPMDVKASKLLGNIAVGWSFAVTELPPGSDVAVPRWLRDRLKAAEDEPASLPELERSFASLLNQGGTPR